MTARRLGWITLGLLAACLVAVPSQADVEADANDTELNRKLVTAATDALEATRARYEVGRATLEEVYTWSRRVVEANHRSEGSLAKHLLLMKDLHERTAALNRVGGKGGDAQFLHASEYYLAEAKQLAGL